MRSTPLVFGLMILAILSLSTFSVFSDAEDESIIFSDADGFSFITDGVIKADGYAEAMLIYYEPETPIADVVIPGIVHCDEISADCKVVEVQMYSFVNNFDMVTLTIPETVKTYSPEATFCCTKFKEFIVPVSDHFEAVDGGILVKKGGSTLVRCPEGYLNEKVVAAAYPVLASGAFSFCENLKYVVLSEDTRIIDTDTFKGCINLEYVNLNELTGFNELPDELTFISDRAFSGCAKLIDLVLPDSLRVIAEEAFLGCSSLTSITIPASVSIIEEKAFSNCEKLVNFKVAQYSAYYKSIDDVLFKINEDIPVELVSYPCGKVGETYKIPNHLIRIYPGAFEGNKNLKEVILADDMTEIYRSSFEGMEALERMTLSDAITVIGVSAFMNCNNLKTVVMSPNLVDIQDFAFSNCSQLVDVVLPSKLIIIEEFAFSGCVSLRTITLPDTVRYVSEGAFYSSELDSIRIEGKPELMMQCLDTGKTLKVIHQSDYSIPPEALGDTVMEEEIIGAWTFPTSNIVGIIVCVLMLCGIIALFRRI